MVIIDRDSNETAARAYSQQGHGKKQKPIQRPDTYQRLPEDVQLNTCEQQPVHTNRLEDDVRCLLFERQLCPFFSFASVDDVKVKVIGGSTLWLLSVWILGDACCRLGIENLCPDVFL